jgi:ubiquitin-activating enzyme E1
VTINDNGIVTKRDLGSNFMVSESDINGSTTRAAACLSRLRELNPNVIVDIDLTSLGSNFDNLKNYSILVITEFQSKEFVETANHFCRENKIGFIYSAALGLCGFTFVDFCDEFIVDDENGEEVSHYVVTGVSKNCPGIVTVDHSKPLSLSHGDYVTFKEILGMTELNESPPRPVRVLSPYTFTIEDTSKFADYVAGGIVDQVKVPRPMFFRPLKECFENVYSEECHTSPIDMTKNGRNELLHLCFLSLHEFYKLHSRLPGLNSELDAKELLEIVRKIYTISSDRKRDWAEGLSIEEKVITYVSLYCQAQLPPVCSFLGGIVAQEICKYTGFHTPIYQWLWFDFFECLGTNEISTLVKTTVKDSRYYEQISVFGEDVHKKLSELKVFLVGIGALGSEFLKLFSLMGVSCGDSGELVATDNDIIETSNLNRMFLFRQSDIGKMKSKIAIDRVKQINPSANYKERVLKLEKETDKVFTDDFWRQQDVIFTAVDNIETRRFVDKKITLFSKAMIDTGTLGTKAHSQVIIPNRTSSYNDMQDFMTNMAICTLHNFPSLIEHCIEWGRDEFTGYFFNRIKEINNLMEDFYYQYEIYCKTLDFDGLKMKINDIVNIASIGINKDFRKCVEYGVTTFIDTFDYRIRRLLIKYPLDLINTDGSKFWSGSKTPPNPVNLDLNDPMHMLYIKSFSMLMAIALSVESSEDVTIIKEVAGRVRKKTIEYDTNKKQSSTTLTYEEQKEKNQMKEYLFSLLRENKNKLVLNEIKFDKDNDSNYHVDFIRAAANVRAQNYKITEVRIYIIT